MKILMLTWEFPPFIAGGLGIACHGLVRALLEAGIHIDLALPNAHDVYFPMSQPAHAESMVPQFISPDRRHEPPPGANLPLMERLGHLGISDFPETYLTPGFSPHWETPATRDWIYASGTLIHDHIIQHLHGNESLFKRVQEFTTTIMHHAAHFDADVIHAHDWLTYPAAVLLKKITGKPLVVHIHATEFDRSAGSGDERIHNIEFAGLNQADHVIAVSRYTAQMIMDRYLVPAHKITVIHNAFSFSPEKPVKRYKLFKDPVVLFMGRVTIQKGPDYFIDVAEKVIHQHPDVRFIMAGSGDMFSRMLIRSARKRLKDRCLFTGFLTRAQVEHMLAATDIFVMPSVSEPFGIAPLEAMFYGSAAIISNQSGVKEVVENAFKIDFWDIHKMVATIVDLLKHPDKRLAIAEAGRLEVLKMAWKTAADSTTQIYRGLSC